MIRYLPALFTVFLLLFALPGIASAQGYFHQHRTDYVDRVTQLSSGEFSDHSYSFRSISLNSPQLIEPGLAIDLLSPLNFQIRTASFINSYNTYLPRGSNDGAIWQGVGYNAGIEVSTTGRYGPLHFSFNPVVGISQNLQYNLGPYPVVNGQEYAYRIRPNLDYVQRFGDRSRTMFDLGDSFVDVRYNAFAAGISNSRYWTGPSTHNPLLFGYNAPGFLHIHWGTHRPISSRIGNFEFRHIYGVLHKSDYLDQRSDNRLTSVNSLFFVYSPSYFKGFSIGLNRVYIEEYPSSFGEFTNQFKKLFDPVYREALQSDENPSGWDPDNQIISIFARLHIPEYRFEIYTEYARGDQTHDGVDFILHPDHLRAYNFGLIKSYLLDNGNFFAINLELTQTESTRNTMTRGRPASTERFNLLGSWFTHGSMMNGFTNRGQIMAGGLGPGGNSQLINLDYFGREASFGLTFHRIVHHNTLVDNNTSGRQFYDLIRDQNEPGTPRWKMRNTEFMLGLRATYQINEQLRLLLHVDQSRIFNHFYIDGNDKWNTRVEITLSKKFRGN